jgi:hypothetical protein
LNRVALLTTITSQHELTHSMLGYTLTTTVDGQVVSERQLTQAEAMEWIETVKRCGGVVYEREVVR